MSQMIAIRKIIPIFESGIDEMVRYLRGGRDCLIMLSDAHSIVHLIEVGFENWDPLIVNRSNILIDGHHRLAILKHFGVQQSKVKYITEFSSMDEFRSVIGDCNLWDGRTLDEVDRFGEIFLV